VFVVASADPWTPSDPTSIPPDEAFHTCTVTMTREQCAPLSTLVMQKINTAQGVQLA
jgi:hypothetical protein